MHRLYPRSSKHAPVSRMILACVLLGSDVQTTCDPLLFGQIQLDAGLQNRLGRRHSSLHPDHRIAPVTALGIGQTRSRGKEGAGPRNTARGLMGIVVNGWTRTSEINRSGRNVRQGSEKAVSMYVSL